MSFKNKKGYLFASIFFILSLFLGIWDAKLIRRSFVVRNASFYPQASFSLSRFSLSLSIAFLIIFFILFFPRGRKIRKWILKLLFLLTFFLGGLIFFSPFLGDIISLFLVLFLSLLWLISQNIFIHNVCMFGSVVGISVILGLEINPFQALILLLGFSFYDMGAVFLTKHMQKMAKKTVSLGTPLAFIFSSDASFYSQKISSFRIKENFPSRRFFILGGGDIAFPLIFLSSLSSQSKIFLFLVSMFSFLGFLLDILIFDKKKKPLPALPLIALFSIGGYLLGKIFLL